MDVAEYTRHDATALAELVRNGEVHPTELAQAAVGAIERVNGRINGVIEVYDDATEQPDAAGESFAGVPFLRDGQQVTLLEHGLLRTAP